MEKYSSEGKSLKEVLRDFENLGSSLSVQSALPRAMSAVIQARLTEKLCASIDTAGEGFVKQMSDLKIYVEAAKKDVNEQSGLLRESFWEVRDSLDEFKKSNEKSSRALTRATYVLAAVALIQVVIIAWPLFK